MKKNLSISVCIPVYKGSDVLKKTLKSVFKQKFTDYEVVIVDDNPPKLKKEIKKTKKIVDSFQDPRIKYFKNKKNFGCMPSIQKITDLAQKNIIFWLAQDDILAKDALQKTHDAFFLDKNIGAVTRPYFWFETDVAKPVRAIFPPNNKKDTILSIYDGARAIKYIFGSIGQMSGLAFKKKYIDTPVGVDIFPGHIYPIASILKKYKCVFLKDYTVAVAIGHSQSRHISSIYDKSPTESWVKMFNKIYEGKKFEKIRKECITHIATHYLGLVQIKNFGPRGTLEKEIIVLLKYHPKSIFSLKFWFYSLITLLLPKKILLIISDNYKKLILAKHLGSIKFEI